MICGASIAKRDGTHRKCMRPDQHDGDCSPLVFPTWSPRPPAPALSRLQLLKGAAVPLLIAVAAVLLCSIGGGP